MKFFGIIIIALCAFVSNCDAQLFYLNTASISNASLSTCSTISINVSGNYSDGCGYKPNLPDAAVVVGNTIFVSTIIRNLGCDSGLFCTMALVPTTFTTNAMLPSIASGNYNLVLVIKKICSWIPNIVNDTVALGAVTVSNSNSNFFASLSSNQGNVLQLGTPITYSLTTNLQSVNSVLWYRNGVQVAATTSLMWSTTQSSAKDSVYAILQYGSGSCAYSFFSNSFVSTTVATALANITQHQRGYRLQGAYIILDNLATEEKYLVINSTGQKVGSGVISSRDAWINTEKWLPGFYILRTANWYLPFVKM